jgi:hypothetical protein
MEDGWIMDGSWKTKMQNTNKSKRRLADAGRDGPKQARGKHKRHFIDRKQDWA